MLKRDYYGTKKKKIWFVYCFIVFSFIGFLYEVILSIVLNRICDPGFLVGPYLLVYGITIVSVYLLLGSRKNKNGVIKIMTNHRKTNIVVTSIIYMLISGGIVTLVELISAFALDVNFNVRLWDYSVMPMNYNGYISIPTSLLWIFIIPIIMNFLFDPIYEVIKKIPFKVSMVVNILLVIILFVDIIFNVSFILINGYSFRFI